ncbi:MAG TPA: hypothetical protein VIN60_03925 [Anaerolineales bacterium]
MKNIRTLRIFLVLALVSIGLFLPAHTVQAKHSKHTERNGTLLSVQLPKSVKLDETALVVIQLNAYDGYPIAGKIVHLLVNGVLAGTGKTNDFGTTSIRFKREEAGTYTLAATYDGSRKGELLPSSVSASLEVQPAMLEVQTVPPLPGIQFSLGNQVFVSGNDGIARIAIPVAGTYPLEVVPGNPAESKNNIRSNFSRWGDEVFVSYRDVNIPTAQTLQAGFEVSYPVSHSFVDLGNQPIDPSRITSFTLKSSDGVTSTFNDNQPHWLEASRVVRLNNGLQETKILYSVVSVVMKGSNVVSQAQQRFFVHQNDMWPIQVMLYSARFSARDALFLFPIGSGIKLQYPNGQIQALSFGLDSEHIVQVLPRGIYTATVVGAQGMAPSTPIALSRDQNVDLLVVSYLDMIALLVLGLGLAFGFVFVGRPRLFWKLAAINPFRQLPWLRERSHSFQEWRQR